jgi:hypothetical protein
MNRIQRYLIAFAVTLWAIMIASPTARAAVEPTPNVVDEASGTLWVVSAWWVSLITAAVIPFVTGIVTRWNTRSGIKTAITIVLNLGAAFFATGVLEDGTALFSGQMVQTFVLNVIISLAAYEWGWKKAGLTSSAIALPDPARPGQTVMVPGKLATIGLK